MIAGRASNAAAVEAIDAQVRSLYRRLRDSGPSHAGLAGATRALHAVLKDIRTETRNLSGLLNSSSPKFSAASSSELFPLLEACDLTLKQLSSILGRYGSGSSNYSTSSLSADTDGSNIGPSANTAAATAAIPVIPGAENVNRAEDTFALARSKISSHTTKLSSFLETVSLHNPLATGSAPLPPSPEPHMPSISPMPPEDEGLDTIKDRVDAIATRLSHQDLISASQFGAASVDEMWQVFYSELIYEGFSTEALSANQVTSFWLTPLVIRRR